MVDNNSNNSRRLVLADVAPTRSDVEMPSGRTYQLRTSDDFGLEHYARAQGLLARVTEIEQAAAEELTAEQIAEYERNLRQFVGMVLIDCPAEEVEHLTPGQLLRVTTFFIERMPPHLVRPNLAPPEQPPDPTDSNGRRSSPDSAGSTAEHGTPTSETPRSGASGT